MTPYLVIDEKGQWGKVFKNFTGYGVIGNLAMDKADVGLGNKYCRDHRKITTKQLLFNYRGFVYLGT